MIQALSIPAGFLLVGAVALVVVDSTHDAAPASSRSVSYAPSRVERLVTSHDCWTGTAPDPAVIPEHAVVTLPGERSAYVSSEIGFDIWLHGKPGLLHAFCV